MPRNTMEAPCGIDCAACDIYLAAQDPEEAKRLAVKWHDWNPDAKPDWFRCQGCHGERTVRWCDDCRIADCCGEKGLDDCSQCADFPCQPYTDWIGPYAHHQAAFERLKAKAAGARPA